MPRRAASQLFSFEQAWDRCKKRWLGDLDSNQDWRSQSPNWPPDLQPLFSRKWRKVVIEDQYVRREFPKPKRPPPPKANAARLSRGSGVAKENWQFSNTTAYSVEWLTAQRLQSASWSACRLPTSILPRNLKRGLSRPVQGWRCSLKEYWHDRAALRRPPHKTIWPVKVRVSDRSHARDLYHLKNTKSRKRREGVSGQARPAGESLQTLHRWRLAADGASAVAVHRPRLFG